MYSEEKLKKFVAERLTAAAEDIFVVFKRTVVEYEVELERQRQLLDIFLKPQVNLHRIDVCKEEEVLSRQLYNQDQNSSPDQEEPEPPQMKEEPVELCSIQQGEQLILKDGTEMFTLTSTQEERPPDVCKEDRNASPDREEPETPQIEEGPEEPCSIHQGEQLILKEETDMFMLTPIPEEGCHGDPELQQENELLSYYSYIAGDQNPTGSNHRVSEPNVIHQSSHNAYMSGNALRDQQSFKCDTCGESFKHKTALKTHQHVHSGKQIHSCKICGKMFGFKSLLAVHLRSHTGERPFFCKICGKRFYQMSGLKKHNVQHTGEQPFTCSTCGKSFRLKKTLKAHMGTHTTCSICGESFSQSSELNTHIQIHETQKPVTCAICGRSFKGKRYLKIHMKIHTGEKPPAQPAGKASFA